MKRRISAAGLAACLIASGACTNDADDVAASATSEPFAKTGSTAKPLAKSAESSKAKRLTLPKADSLERSSSTAQTTTTLDPSTTTTVAPSEPPPSEPAPIAGPIGTTPLTAPASGGSQNSGDPSGIYKGILGKLGLDEVLAQPIVNPPDAVPGVGPLTGLPGQVPNRPPIVVKIDNSSKARPQAGINAADIIVEEEVEWGITRLAAVFHTNSQQIGPVRSGRTTDIGILNAFGNPMLVYSGANAVTDALLRNQARVTNRGASSAGGAYWRQSGRRAPSNMFTDLGKHWAAVGGNSPLPIFAYRPQGQTIDGTPQTQFGVGYKSTKVRWAWDGSAWRRTQNGSAHVDAYGLQAGATNVVVVETQRVDTGMVDSAGSVVPEFVWVGQGRSTVFTDGKRVEGTWTRPTLASRPTFTRADGSVIALAPGRTWIHLVDKLDQQVG